MAVALAFILSRLFYHAAGIRFDAWENSHPMQFLFPELLKNDLLSSLWHLHSQPPLFNLFLGIVYKLFPGNETPVFSLVYLIGGAVLSVCLYLLMKRLGISTKTSAAVTIVFIISPPVILFENILLYTHPVAVMLVLSAYLLHRFMNKGHWMHGAAFFTIIATVVLTRSLFHMVWYLAAFALVLAGGRNRLRSVLIMGLIPFVAVAGVYLKNHVLFGSFSTSSWLGASFAKVTTSMLPEEERLRLVEEGRISELALIPPIQGLWVYHSKARVPETERTGIPILDMEYQPSVGNNYNNLSILSLIEQYRRDALTVVRMYPTTWLKGMARAYVIYFFPASDWFISIPFDNLKNIDGIARIYTILFYGQFRQWDRSLPTNIHTYNDHVHNPGNAGFFLPLIYLLALGAGIMLVWRDIRAGKTTSPRAVTAAFMVMTILYISSVANLFEILENERFRYLTEPFAAVLFAVFIDSVIRKLRRRAG